MFSQKNENLLLHILFSFSCIYLALHLLISTGLIRPKGRKERLSLQSSAVAGTNILTVKSE